MAVRRPHHVAFSVIMVIFAGALTLVYHDNGLGVLLAPVTTMTARMTLEVLHWFGIAAAGAGTVLSHPAGFAYEISYRCTGFLPTALLITSILAYPGSLRRKCVGIALGVPILIVLNLTRLVHLFYLGVHDPATFALAHAVLWEGLLIVATFGLWLAWARWSDLEAPHHTWAGGGPSRGQRTGSPQEVVAFLDRIPS